VTDQFIHSSNDVVERGNRNLIIYSEHRNVEHNILVAETIKADTGGGRILKYGWFETPFGRCFTAMLNGYVCHFSFVEENELENEVQTLKARWPEAMPKEGLVGAESSLASIFDDRLANSEDTKILLRGSRFQLAVWKQLLRIKRGEIVSYQDIANRLGRPDSVRAVGTAIGKNEIAVLVPCHRVVSTSGAIGQYRWGTNRKKCLLSHERANYLG